MFARPAVSTLQRVADPVLLANSCAMSSDQFQVVGVMKLTVIVEVPATVTVPSQSSVSGLVAKCVSRLHVAPPPLIDCTACSTCHKRGQHHRIANMLRVDR